MYSAIQMRVRNTKQTERKRGRESEQKPNAYNANAIIKIIVITKSVEKHM